MTKAEKPDKPKSKLTDEDRHKRFLNIARAVNASESSGDFDRAFDGIVTPNRLLKKGARRR